MTRAAIAGFYFECVGVTREEVIDRMDTLALTILDQVGGAPWRMVTDGVERVQAQSPLHDDEGFSYVGTRKYIFAGPLVSIPFHAYHDGAKPQNAIEESM